MFSKTRASALEPASASSDTATEIFKKTEPTHVNGKDSKVIEQVNPQFSGIHEFFFIFTVVSAQLISQIGVSQALSSLFRVGDYFGVARDDQAQLSWAIAAYSLTAGTFILLGGRLGNMVGNKRMFIFGYIWLGLWSLIAGFSYYLRDSPILFYTCRGLQGVGAAFLLPNGLTLLGRTYSAGAKKTFVFAAFGACTPIGFVIGSTFGSLISQLCLKWAWIYWSMAIVCCLFAVLCVFVIPNDGFKISFKKSFCDFDYMGSVTGVAGLLLFNVAWNQVPLTGWNNPSFYVLMIIGVFSMSAFVVIEYRSLKPLVPLEKISMTVAIVLLCVACGFAAFGVWVYFFWQFLLVIRGHTPLSAAAQFCPVALAGILAAGTTGILFHKKVSPRILILVALVGFLISSILLSTAEVEGSYWTSTFFCTIIAPFGVDVAFPAASLLLSNSVSKEHQDISASLIATTVNYSISLGLGVAGVIDRYVVQTNRPNSSLETVRVASYVACGFSGFGILISLCDILCCKLYPRFQKRF